jgi:hypothetical protein
VRHGIVRRVCSLLLGGAIRTRRECCANTQLYCSPIGPIGTSFEGQKSVRAWLRFCNDDTPVWRKKPSAPVQELDRAFDALDHGEQWRCRTDGRPDGVRFRLSGCRHDSQRLDGLLITANTSLVYADSAYRSAETQAKLDGRGFEPHP